MHVRQTEGQNRQAVWQEEIIMELLIAIPVVVGILYLKGRCQRFFYYGSNPLKGRMNPAFHSRTISL